MTWKTATYAPWHRHHYEKHQGHIAYWCEMRAQSGMDCAGDTRGAVRMTRAPDGELYCPACQEN